jgi:hypothetical protein
MEPISSEDIMMSYSTAYLQLYNHMPKDLRAIDDDWVVVNGARMPVSELLSLTKQLQQEYRQSQNHQRNIVARLIQWFKG